MDEAIACDPVALMKSAIHFRQHSSETVSKKSLSSSSEEEDFVAQRIVQQTRSNAHLVVRLRAWL